MWTEYVVMLVLTPSLLAANQRADIDLALTKAVQSGDSKSVEELLVKGANPNTTDNDGCPVLVDAAFEGNVAIVRALLAKDANVNAPDKEGQTALMLAARRGHGSVVEALLERRAKLNVKSKEGATPLWNAILGCEGMPSKSHIVELMLANGAEVNARNLPLLMATAEDCPPIIELLRKAAAKK
jgi:ankyrin repeat protein